MGHTVFPHYTLKGAISVHDILVSMMLRMQSLELFFFQIWPENTDPQKFVYEDVAIATYLILLFEEERKETGDDKKQSYVDLGCGNGLLVHILNSEGVSHILI